MDSINCMEFAYVCMYVDIICTYKKKLFAYGSVATNLPAPYAKFVSYVHTWTIIVRYGLLVRLLPLA